MTLMSTRQREMSCDEMNSEPTSDVRHECFLDRFKKCLARIEPRLGGRRALE